MSVQAAKEILNEARKAVASPLIPAPVRELVQAVALHLVDQAEDMQALAHRLEQIEQWRSDSISKEQPDGGS